MQLGNLLDSLKVWVENIISTGGYPGLYFVMFLENVFPPIPSEVVLPLAGSLSLTGRFFHSVDHNCWNVRLSDRRLSVLWIGKMARRRTGAQIYCEVRKILPCCLSKISINPRIGSINTMNGSSSSPVWFPSYAA